MNTGSIKRRLRACKGCAYLCTSCPHALPCVRQGQKVRPTECYLCWHNQGTVLPKDCRLRRTPIRTKVHV
jgi:Fe-S-cluster-containing dehydrogenase component